MKLSKIAALFMVPVLALCLVACSAPGGNASESASSDPKIAELTAQKPTNADATPTASQSLANRPVRCR